MPRPAFAVPILAVLATPLVSQAAYAQAQTGTGGGPGSTITAPNTSSVGQTMPPAGGGAATAGGSYDRRTPEQKEDDKISRGICIGCGPK